MLAVLTFFANRLAQKASLLANDKVSASRWQSARITHVSFVCKVYRPKLTLVSQQKWIG